MGMRAVMRGKCSSIFTKRVSVLQHQLHSLILQLFHPSSDVTTSLSLWMLGLDFLDCLPARRHPPLRRQSFFCN